MLRQTKNWGIGICLLLALTGYSADAWAQLRLYARVEPNKDPNLPTLVFDTNLEQADNISPNIVFSSDSKRGYVAYPGSGVVLAFDVASGTVLNRIQTGGHPFCATPLADQRTILIPAVLKDGNNRIFAIDMDAGTLAATYTFSNAGFGFGSVITVSPDGQSAYISSTQTGEVIKFNPASGAELGRLKGLEGPAQTTITPDGSTLLVVDVQTSQLLFVNPSTLAIRNTFKALNTDVNANFTVFNKPVLSPDGTMGLLASRDQNSTILPSGNAFIFKTSTGELLDTEVIGTDPGYTTLSPDGKYWMVFNQYSISFVPTADPKSQQEVSLVQGEALGSANIVFSPDGQYAYYAASNHNLVFQQDMVTKAVVDQVLIGTDPAYILEQPSSMAITPDGKSIAVLDFISNNIELLTANYRANATKFISSPTMFTGLSLINLSNSSARVTIEALDDYGSRITDTNVTNPVVYVLDPNKQVSLTVSQLFNFDDTTERTGWITIVSDQPNAVGYVTIGDNTLDNVNGISLFRNSMSSWLIPEIVRQEGYTVEMDFVNPNYNQGSYDIVRVNADGTEPDTRAANGISARARLTQNFGDIFTTPDVSTDGYLRISSPMGLYFSEFFGTSPVTGALNGINLDKYAGVTTVYSPQFAVAPGWQSLLNVINGSGEEADVTITLHAADGSTIGQPFTKHFVKGEQLKGSLAAIFSNDPAVNNVTGWLEVHSTQDRIVGTLTFTDDNNRFLSSFELIGTPLNNFMFPVLGQDDVYQTGLALLNNNAVPARVTVEVWSPEGNLDRTTSITLDPQSRTAVYLDSYFPDLGSRLKGNIRVHSDQPLIGFAMMNDRSYNFALSIPATPLP